jgi:hypothetical protein
MHLEKAVDVLDRKCLIPEKAVKTVKDGDICVHDLFGVRCTQERESTKIMVLLTKDELNINDIFPLLLILGKQHTRHKRRISG